MQKVVKYAVFKTKWGYFGLAGTEYALCRTQLPGPKPEKIKALLLKNLLAPNRVPRQSRDRKGVVIHEHQVSSIEFDKTFFKTLQEQIAAYFEGACVNFSRDIPLALDGFSSFGISVLTTCRDIGFGQTITYGRLAKKSGRPNASRAVGSALAKNPLPLLIPCHRVIRSDGKLGGFSAPGGVNLKKRLLLHEKTNHSI
ncbi:MAG: methylated-DNA--[protein]-cysteine S-methyltransferase [Planctomycetes bacterium]|nr:methylated-DNA--[protein]-cysteine S-methyltransferase [Planctomycetota bacterium]